MDTGSSAIPSASHSESRAFVALRELFQGRRPLIYLHTSEEQRALQLLQEVSRRLFPARVPVWSWTMTRGLRGPDRTEGPGKLLDAVAVLDFIASQTEPAIFQLCDFHEFMASSSEVRRKLRDLYESNLDTGRFIVITSPLRLLPEELSHQMAFIELHHPDLEEMLDFLAGEAKVLARQGFKVDTSEQAAFKIGRALQGLTVDEARHALRHALALGGKLDGDSTTQLLEEKKLIVNQSGGLINYVDDGTQIEHVGGLEYLKQWLLARRRLFLERESLTAEIVPKGLLVMGVSGCGKSLSVKAISSCFGLPL
jgi:SpoVK/Ycf46/Vps4 family AAA+-type ATPase